ncbi:GntR family transcriptional regulator [Aureimonas altamirensis]|uniref:GntR family transcriptional regulator n=1 Tax=Aureimonas altamirensis TaxID=370622 RepID=UPI0025560F87|nr:GntR family transcriptional regulator [Aureimonas altamirensis]
MARVERQSLTDQIVADIRQQIVSGALPEGMPLRQERLAAELGVSRIPLREAIGRLEAEGLVTSVMHKGAVVSTLSLDEIRELFETWLFSLAIPRMTESDLQVAETITHEMANSPIVEHWAELNFRFHESLYQSSNRSLALKLLRTVHDNANRYVNLQIAVAADVEQELMDHRNLIAFARLRDVEGGVAALREHIERVADGLVDAIAESRRAKSREDVA